MTQPTSIAEAVAALQSITGATSEEMHATADQVLLGIVPKEVADAYYKLAECHDDWWYG